MILLVEEKVVGIHRGRCNHKVYYRLSHDVVRHTHETGHYPIWNEVKFIDRDPHWYTRRVKEAIYIRLHPNNINRDSGIEIPEAWIPTIKKHNNRRTVQQGTTEPSLNKVILLKRMLQTDH